METLIALSGQGRTRTRFQSPSTRLSTPRNRAFDTDLVAPSKLNTDSGAKRFSALRFVCSQPSKMRILVLAIQARSLGQDQSGRVMGISVSSRGRRQYDAPCLFGQSPWAPRQHRFFDGGELVVRTLRCSKNCRSSHVILAMHCPWRLNELVFHTRDSGVDDHPRELVYRKNQIFASHRVCCARR